MKFSGREMPNQRQSRASRVVNGMAALDPAPHRNRLRMKNTANTILKGQRWEHKDLILSTTNDTRGWSQNLPWNQQGTKEDVDLPTKASHN